MLKLIKEKIILARTAVCVCFLPLPKIELRWRNFVRSINERQILERDDIFTDYDSQ